jgi:hypothetical protein
MEVPHHVLVEEIFSVHFLVHVVEVLDFVFDFVVKGIGFLGHVLVAEGRGRGRDGVRGRDMAGLVTRAFACWRGLQCKLSF